MAAEDTRSPIGVSERPSAPAIERAVPTINSVPDALDSAGCFAERLRALYDSTVADLNDCIVESSALPEPLKNRAYSIWLVFLLANEKLAELHQMIDAINDKAHAERRAAAV